jgi:hypothetical protein
VKVVPPRTPGITSVCNAVRTALGICSSCTTILHVPVNAPSLGRPRPSGPAPDRTNTRFSQSSPETKVAIPALLPSHAKAHPAAPSVLADGRVSRREKGAGIEMFRLRGREIPAAWSGRHVTDTGLYLTPLQTVVACRNGLAQAQQLLVYVQVL